jgi:exopolyphosphatase/guanosine-5'-triphosphate,3'-diphosphate pyrophosphatase
MATLQAVIEIGSTGIRLLVAEIPDNGLWEVIDTSEQPIMLGRDVFTSGFVARETLLQCLRVLNRFREQLEGWRIPLSAVTVIATSALREARNRDSVLDRIMVKTGFRVRVIDGIEENRLIYTALIQSLEDELPKLRQKNSLIMEVGGGSTEIMLLNTGRMVAAHSLRIGTSIIEQNIKAMMGSRKDARRLLEEFINNAGGNLNQELKLDKVHQIIALGGEVRLAAKAVGQKVSERCWSMHRGDFDALAETVQGYSIEECIARFNIPYAEAETLAVGFLINKTFIDLTTAEDILTVDTSIREGIIINSLSEPSKPLQEEFYSQVVASAVNLGKRFHFDENHASYVSKAAIQLFDQLQDELGLDRHSRLLLEIAALLHDIGIAIRSHDHHLHSQYIITHSEVFGLTRENMYLISQIARYHRGRMPGAGDTAFFSLPRTDRTAVLKLSSLLRIADALDRGHLQLVRDFSVELKGETFFLKPQGAHDITLERLALSEKADFFEAVFGYKVILL